MHCEQIEHQAATGASSTLPASARTRHAGELGTTSGPTITSDRSNSIISTASEIGAYAPRACFTCSITAAPSIMPYARMSIASTGLSGSSA